MNRLRLFLFTGLLLAMLPLSPQADAGGRGYYNTCTYQQACTHKFYNTYSDWSYLPWPTDKTYYYKVRYYFDAHGVRSLENDGWLYTKAANGGWDKYILIKDYGVKQVGATESGYDPTQLALAKVDQKLAAFIEAQRTADSLDVKSLLPPFFSLAAARLESSAKALQVAAQHDAQIKIAQENRERDESLARLSFAENQAILNSYERGLREYHQGFAAAVSGRASFSSQVNAATAIPLDNPPLVAFIAKNCLTCHGGDQGVKGGVDFRTIDQWEPSKLDDCSFAIASGEMPKGNPLAKEERREASKLFQAEFERAIAR